MLTYDKYQEKTKKEEAKKEKLKNSRLYKESKDFILTYLELMIRTKNKIRKEHKNTEPRQNVLRDYQESLSIYRFAIDNLVRLFHRMKNYHFSNLANSDSDFMKIFDKLPEEHNAIY